MTLEIIAIYFVAFCLFVGSLFVLIGAIGLVRFNNSMARLHAPTKVGTMGVGSLLVASMFHSALLGEGLSIHEFLIMAFLFVTAPISAHFMAKVTLHKNNCEVPPTPNKEQTWSTLNVATDDAVERNPE